jgi:anthranilate synthase component 2
VTGTKILVVDNVDSFTFMLVDYLLALGAGVEVVRNDDLSAAEALDSSPDAFLISPGPGEPDDAGISVELARLCIEHRRPLLGVCLGHQAIARACGSTVERTRPMHGKITNVRHDGTGLLAGLPSPFPATRYHSLAVSRPGPPLIANAWSEEGTVMAMRHQVAPVHGVQFHPESIASDQGRPLLAAFLRLAHGNA